MASSSISRNALVKTGHNLWPLGPSEALMTALAMRLVDGVHSLLRDAIQWEFIKRFLWGDHELAACDSGKQAAAGGSLWTGAGTAAVCCTGGSIVGAKDGVDRCREVVRDRVAHLSKNTQQ